jgi:tRNA-dihydrouridine synthase 3
MELDTPITGSTTISGTGSSDHPQNDADSSNTSSLIKRQVSSSEETFCFRLKAEFIVEERPPCLTPLDAPKPVIQGAEAAPVVQLKEEEQNEESGKKKKMRGMNKKRPRDAKVSVREKVCLSVLQGNICPFVAKGDDEQCPYNHDLTLLLQERPQDISEVGICPLYHRYGKCSFGVLCRFGSCHINLTTGENILKDETRQPDAVLNELTKETQWQLRKNTYPFKCKRYFEVKKRDDSNKTNGAVPQNHKPTNDASPLPAKERKLIDFSNKVYVAPLTTVGNLPFRRIMKKFGADITCGEMAVAQNLLEGKPSEWALLKRHSSEDVFGVQIACGHADQFTRVAELIENECQVDFMDMNCGCPLDCICSKGAGSMLMLREHKLRDSLRGISSALSCPFTVKMRTGWDEKEPILHKLVPKIQSWQVDGLSCIMVHGRSRLQRYSRLADWNYISEVAKSQTNDLPKIPVIGNGDIFSFTDYEQRLRDYPEVLPTAMIARGALIKPWLPTEIKERRHWDISASERLDFLKEFVTFGLEHWGTDQHGVNNTRRFLLEFLSFLCRYVPVYMLEVLPQQMNQRPPVKHMCGRSDLETLMLSSHCGDWIKISEMLLGRVPDGFRFEPKVS